MLPSSFIMETSRERTTLQVKKKMSTYITNTNILFVSLLSAIIAEIRMQDNLVDLTEEKSFDSSCPLDQLLQHNQDLLMAVLENQRLGRLQDAQV